MGSLQNRSTAIRSRITPVHIQILLLQDFGNVHPSVHSGWHHGDPYHTEEGGSVVYSLQTEQVVLMAGYTDYCAQSD